MRLLTISLRYTKRVNRFTDQVWHKWLGRPYRLHVSIDRGEGKPVVLLHGIGRNGTFWQALADLLSPKYHVIAPDLLGFGASPKPDWNDYDIDAHARAVIKSLRAHRLGDKITLVGHSMGCLVAVHVATLAPDIISRLVLYEPPLYADDPEYRSHARRRKVYFKMYEMIADNPASVITYSRLLRRMLANVAALATNKQDWLPFERSLRNTIMQQTGYDELKAINVPTDIIYGRLDFVVSRSDIKDMLASNRHIQFHTVTDMHALSKRSATFLARLISTTPGSAEHQASAVGL
jgi:pimeloyl-ACP methyl ester carboxylesterase